MIMIFAVNKQIVKENHQIVGVNNNKLTVLHCVDQHRFQSICDGHDDRGPNEWHNLEMLLY